MDYINSSVPSLLVLDDKGSPVGVTDTIPMDAAPNPEYLSISKLTSSKTHKLNHSLCLTGTREFDEMCGRYWNITPYKNYKLLPTFSIITKDSEGNGLHQDMIHTRSTMRLITLRII